MNNAMDYQQVIDSLSPEIYERLQRAVELGKWPDGSIVSADQRANAMQAVIAWGERHLPQADRPGFIERKPHIEAPCDTPLETPLNWVE